MVNSVLNFTIKADTAQMEGSAKRAGSALSDLGGAASSMASKFQVTESNAARVAKSLGVELSSGAERAVSKLEGLRDHLTRTGAPAADLVRVTEALAEADKKYAASLTTTTQKMSVWEEHGTAMAATAGVMTTALFGFGVVAVKAFGETQKVAAQLDAVLESTGHAAGITKEEVLGLADALSRITPFDDEVIVQGETLMLQFTAIGKDIFPRATKAMLDLAARMEIDVPSAAKMLGKALDQPAEGFTALAKATGKFTDAQVASIKDMVAFGETGKAQAMVLDLVEQKVGGAAEALGKTLPGQLAIAQTAAGNFNEEVGSKLVPTLQDLITEFPNVAAAAVGVMDAWKNLGISGGELLIAVPLLKTAFAGMGASLTAMVAASGPIALGIIGFTALAGTIYAAVSAGKALNEWQRSATQANNDAARATDALTKKANEYGVALKKGNETQEQFNARLFQSIAAYEKLHPQIKETQTATVQHTSKVQSHVITLQQQIDKQRALVESLSRQVGKDQELTEATAKLDSMLKTAGGSTKKLSDDMAKLEKQYSSTTGAALLQIEAIKKDITFMEQHRGSAEALAGAHNKLEQATLAFIVAQSRFPELLKNSTVAHQTTTVAMLGEMTALEQLNAAYERYLGTVKAFADLDLSGVMISNDATFAAANDRAREGIAIWEKLPEALKPAKQSFEDMGKQISTIATDLSKGLADALIKWRGFGESMKKVGQEFGTAITRTFLESMMEPLTKEDGLFDRLGKKLSEQFEKVGKKIQDFFGKLFDDITEFMGTTLGKIIGAVTGAGIALAGYKTGNKAMGAAGGALMGAELGSFFGPWGTAIGAGAGAVGGFIAGAFGARGQAKKTATGGAETLSADAWGAVADVKAGNLSIQEGIDAVNAAWLKYEAFLRLNVKDQTVVQRSLDTQRITLTQSLAELDAMKLAAGTAADGLAADLKAKTDELVEKGMQGIGNFLAQMRVAGPTDDIIKGLEGIAAAMAETGREAETSAANLAVLGAEFLKTGKMTDQFAAALESAGGSADFFNEMTGEIQRLQGLRSELGVLKQMIDSLIPKQRTWQEEFFETGKITDAMAEKIREAGGDIEQFKKFADVRGVKTRFEQLTDEFSKTGVATQELLDLMGEFGGAEVKAAFQKLMDEAKASGKTVGQLGKDSESSAAAIQAAFESTSAGINTAFTNAAQKLSDALTKMDQNLSLAIQGLQSAMVTMIKDLIDVILGVPGAAAKAAADANFYLGSIHDRNIKVTIQAQFEGFGGLDEYERRLKILTDQGFAPGTVGAPIPTPGGPTFPSHALGTSYVPRTGLALLHQGEAVIPASQNRGSTGGMGSVVFNIERVETNNPEAFVDGLTSMMQTNRNGARVKLLKAMKLAERGKF